jgi:WD40 repeat protein
MSGEPAGQPIRSSQAMTGVAFSPAADVFAAASRDGSVTIVRRASGKAILPPLVHQTAVVSLAFSPDGKRLATGCEDGQAVIWDAVTGRSMSASLRHSFAVSAVAFSPDSLRLATGSEDGTARVWDAATGQPLSEALQHAGPVRSLSFNPDGHRLFTGSVDGKVGCWQMAPGLGRNDRLSLASFARLLSRVSLKDSGGLEPQLVSPLAALRGRAQLDARGEVSILLNWLFSVPIDRALTPHSFHTMRDYINARIEEGTPLSLDTAELLAEGDSILRGRIKQKRRPAESPTHP